MAVRFVHDVAAFAYVEAANGSGLMTAGVTPGDFADLGVSLLLCGFVLWYFLRRSNTDAPFAYRLCRTPR